MPPGAGVPTPGASMGSNASRSSDTPYPAVPARRDGARLGQRIRDAAASDLIHADDANAVPLRKHDLLGLEAARTDQTDVLAAQARAGRRPVAVNFGAP